jgi:hypothetical protein
MPLIKLAKVSERRQCATDQGGAEQATPSTIAKQIVGRSLSDAASLAQMR